MDCNCPDETYTQSTVEGVVICTKITTIEDMFCPEGCQTIIRENGTAYCDCSDTEVPTLVPIKKPIYFDNMDYFTDTSWTISYNPQMGTWESYFSFYPDYSPSNNSYFQTGYNWGDDKGTLWNHTMNNNSFQVFQGKLNPFIVEYPIINENAQKMLNSLSLNIEAKRYQNQWDSAVWANKGFNKLVIWNNTNNSGVLNLIEQKKISDARNYPVTNIVEGTQDILFVPENGKHIINYFFNRTINQDSNIPQWIRDKNNIFKAINQKAVSFRGKRTSERLRGSEFLINLTNDTESRFSVVLKSSIDNSTITE